MVLFVVSVAPGTMEQQKVLEFESKTTTYLTQVWCVVALAAATWRVTCALCFLPTEAGAVPQGH